MNAETINSVIDNLAAKLAVPAEKLFELLPRTGVRLIPSTAISLCLVLIGIVFVYISCRQANKYHKQINTKYDSENYRAWLAWVENAKAISYYWILIASIIGIITIIILGFVMWDAIDLWYWLHDPEAWAFTQLLNKLR